MYGRLQGSYTRIVGIGAPYQLQRSYNILKEFVEPYSVSLGGIKHHRE
jgi:hypothetical protein